MDSTPSVIVFDVNETLSDMSALARYFTETGAPAYLAQLWFAGLLRDGFALAASGDNAGFADIGAESLRGLLRPLPLNRELDQAVGHIMGAFSALTVHPDVAGGVRQLKAAGFRLVTLSNGSPEVADKLFRAAGIREDFEALLSVQDAPAWKPAKAAYEHAVHTCGTETAGMLLVAVHPWDIHGASRAGLRTAWLNRAQAQYPGYFQAPDYIVDSLEDLAAVLAGGA
ncbi:haloacid dehalogenase type II [Arthrobacter mobilis]|uniref:Haloacid dehalogenase type II n=1 Tax=Arthrobacter mobilis TaxID=2724944 RepID=A0A7X6K6V8_9MICC|nr:haloacid dehalogenase type II [Arthrobacter mobilis]NKX55733.1 haloacid dehalogenase type II [Arthrobacter mobilis]